MFHCHNRMQKKRLRKSQKKGQSAMSRKPKFFLICFCVILISSVALAEVKFTKLLKQIQPAVITIITYDRNNKVVGQASGFFVDHKGHIITNYHVLKGAHNAEIKTYDDKRYPIKSVVAHSEAADLIKLLVDMPEESIRFVKVTKTPPAVAERVLVVGSPMGLEQTVSEGIVSAVREIPNAGRIFQISAPISPGSSGSPVINMKGIVIGVATFQFLEGQNLNFAIPSEYVNALKHTKSGKTIAEWITIASIAKTKIAKELYENKEYKKALPFFKEASEINPVSQTMWHNLADCYKKLHQRNKAIEAYEQAIRYNPDGVMTYMSYGLLGSNLLEDFRCKEAIEAYKQGLRKMNDRTANSIIGALFYQKIGESYVMLAAMNGRKAIQQAIVQGTDISKTNKNKYLIKAVKAYKEAIRREPDRAYCHSEMGSCYLRLNRYREAKEAFKQAIRINPGNVDAHYSMGIIYLRENNRGAALEQYKILKKLGSDRSALFADELFNSINEEKK